MPPPRRRGLRLCDQPSFQTPEISQRPIPVDVGEFKDPGSSCDGSPVFYAEDKHGYSASHSGDSISCTSALLMHEMLLEETSRAFPPNVDTFFSFTDAELFTLRKIRALQEELRSSATALGQETSALRRGCESLSSDWLRNVDPDPQRLQETAYPLRELAIVWRGYRSLMCRESVLSQRGSGRLSLGGVFAFDKLCVDSNNIDTTARPAEGTKIFTVLPLRAMQIEWVAEFPHFDDTFIAAPIRQFISELKPPAGLIPHYCFARNAYVLLDPEIPLNPFFDIEYGEWPCGNIEDLSCLDEREQKRLLVFNFLIKPLLLATGTCETDIPLKPSAVAEVITWVVVHTLAEALNHYFFSGEHNLSSEQSTLPNVKSLLVLSSSILVKNNSFKYSVHLHFQLNPQRVTVSADADAEGKTSLETPTSFHTVVEHSLFAKYFLGLNGPLSEAVNLFMCSGHLFSTTIRAANIDCLDAMQWFCSQTGCSTTDESCTNAAYAALARMLLELTLDTGVYNTWQPFRLPFCCKGAVLPSDMFTKDSFLSELRCVIDAAVYDQGVDPDTLFFGPAPSFLQTGISVSDPSTEYSETFLQWRYLLPLSVKSTVSSTVFSTPLLRELVIAYDPANKTTSLRDARDYASVVIKEALICNYVLWALRNGAADGGSRGCVSDVLAELVKERAQRNLIPLAQTELRKLLAQPPVGHVVALLQRAGELGVEELAEYNAISVRLRSIQRLARSVEKLAGPTRDSKRRREVSEGFRRYTNALCDLLAYNCLRPSLHINEAASFASVLGLPSFMASVETEAGIEHHPKLPALVWMEREGHPSVLLRTGGRVSRHISDKDIKGILSEVFRCLTPEYDLGIPEAGCLPISAERLTCNYNEDCGVRMYDVRQKLNKFCIRQGRVHRSTFAQIYLYYSVISVKCWSNDCNKKCLRIYWNNHSHVDEESSKKEDVVNSMESRIGSNNILYPRYDRLEKLHAILFPELSSEEIQSRYAASVEFSAPT